MTNLWRAFSGVQEQVQQQQQQQQQRSCFMMRAHYCLSIQPSRLSGSHFLLPVATREHPFINEPMRTAPGWLSSRTLHYQSDRGGAHGGWWVSGHHRVHHVGAGYFNVWIQLPGCFILFLSITLAKSLHLQQWHPVRVSSGAVLPPHYVAKITLLLNLLEASCVSLMQTYVGCLHDFLKKMDFWNSKMLSLSWHMMHKWSTN